MKRWHPRCTGARSVAMLLAMGAAIAFAPAESSRAADDSRPNIIIILSDNLGYGELACYGGYRKVPTPRIDALAAEGLRLTNFNVETWCAPSRSALLTGRFGIRSGTDYPTNGVQGMTQWEVTLAELLSSRGYATAIYGKWHLGDTEGRFPTDQGFDEWYGIARTWNSGLAGDSPGYIPKQSQKQNVLESTRGGKVRDVGPFDTEAGRHIDRVLADKSCDYIRRNGGAKKPFFLFLSMAAVHTPVYVDPEFDGKSGVGIIGDAVMAMDYDVGLVLDAISQAGITDDTIVIFTSDNGPEYQTSSRGTAGPWRGTYGSALEGSLRVPFLMRWPGHVRAGRVSDGMVHIVDLFTSLAPIVGARIPTDRAIDGVDQMPFFTEKQEKSNREGFPVFVYGELWAVKWRDWKLHEVWRPAGSDPVTRAYTREGYVFPLPSAAPGPRYVRKLFNTRIDPQEELDVFLQNRAVALAMDHVVSDFQASLVKYPLIRPGTADPYQPLPHP